MNLNESYMKQTLFIKIVLVVLELTGVISSNTACLCNIVLETLEEHFGSYLD